MLTIQEVLMNCYYCHHTAVITSTQFLLTHVVNCDGGIRSFTPTKPLVICTSHQTLTAQMLILQAITPCAERVWLYM